MMTEHDCSQGPLQLLNGVPFSETDQLRQQLQVAAAQISKAAVEASLAQMKHEQVNTRGHPISLVSMVALVVCWFVTRRVLAR